MRGVLEMCKAQCSTGHNLAKSCSSVREGDGSVPDVLDVRAGFPYGQVTYTTFPLGSGIEWVGHVSWQCFKVHCVSGTDKPRKPKLEKLIT